MTTIGDYRQRVRMRHFQDSIAVWSLSEQSLVLSCQASSTQLCHTSRASLSLTPDPSPTSHDFHVYIFRPTIFDRGPLYVEKVLRWLLLIFCLIQKHIIFCHPIRK